MKNGFTFKGTHTDRFGITVKTQNRPIVPAVKTKTYTTAFMDGVYDFSKANPYERELYENRTFAVVMQIHGDSLLELHKKLAKISAWLLGSGELIFDDTPLVKWNARCETDVSFAPERHGKEAILTVQFNISPFGSLTKATTEPIVLDDMLRLDTRIPLAVDELYTYTAVIPKEKTSTVSVDMKIPNYGDRPIRPVITILAPDRTTCMDVCILNHGLSSGSGIELNYGDKTLSFSDFRNNDDSRDGFIIDFENQMSMATTYEGNPYIDGEFFELSGKCPEMELKMRVRNGTDTDLTYTITADFRPQVVWDLNVDDFDWSGAYA